MFVGREKGYGGDVPPLRSFFLPSLQALLERSEISFADSGCRSGVVLSFCPTLLRTQAFREQADPAVCPGFPLSPAAVVTSGLHSNAADKPWSWGGGHGLLCSLTGQLWGRGKNRGPDSFPYSPRQELPLGAFPDPKLSLDASLQLLGILVTTLNLFSVTVNV